jgi:hypothetical protein
MKTNSQETKDAVLFIFNVLRTTETSITEFSERTNISRTTLNHWKKGGYINDQLRLTIAYREAEEVAWYKADIP